MSKFSTGKSGIEILLEKIRNIFRAENKSCYSTTDYRAAERKFIKYVLEQRRIEDDDLLLGK